MELGFPTHKQNSDTFTDTGKLHISQVSSLFQILMVLWMLKLF